MKNTSTKLTSIMKPKKQLSEVNEKKPVGNLDLKQHFYDANNAIVDLYLDAVKLKDSELHGLVSTLKDVHGKIYKYLMSTYDWRN